VTTTEVTRRKLEAMRADPKTWPMIWLLADEREARLLVAGCVPISIMKQAGDATAQGSDVTKKRTKAIPTEAGTLAVIAIIAARLEAIALALDERLVPVEHRLTALEQGTPGYRARLASSEEMKVIRARLRALPEMQALRARLRMATKKRTKKSGG
jgi:hypothetical protein